MSVIGRALKKISLVLCMSVFTFSAFSLNSTAAFANTDISDHGFDHLASGFVCPDGNKLVLSVNADIHTDTNTDESYYFLNKNLVVPMGSGNDVYQERWGVWHQLIVQAQTKFPYMPEWLLIFHYGQSKSKYVEGFRAMEAKSEQVSFVRLNKMYCKALQSAAAEY